jgi:tetratricopeptide (TPR) repeat protein
MGVANALRIAVALDPDDPDLAARFEDAAFKASATMVDQYLEQARYEEQHHHFAEAAMAYERALRGRPSDHIHERIAHCLLEVGTDVAKARDMARKGVELAPAVASHRITLARVYARAGMRESALGELERARTLEPNNDSIKEWIKRVRRGEM